MTLAKTPRTPRKIRSERQSDSSWRSLRLGERIFWFRRLHSLELHDPVRLPRLPSVRGLRLLPARGRRCDLRPVEAPSHRLALRVRVVGIEVADAVLEATDRRFTH